MENLETLWSTNKISGPYKGIIYTSNDLYADQDTSFLLKSGVRQDCVMSPLLLILTDDCNWVLGSTVNRSNTGIRWILFTSHEDLDYADDMALL